MREVVISEPALQEENEIWDFIAFGNPVSGDPQAAFRVLQAFQETYASLAEFPYRREVFGKGVFLSPVEGFSQYLVLYQFDETTLEVLHVLRADLDWTRLL